MLEELLRLHDAVEAEVAAQERLLRDMDIPSSDDIARARWKFMSAVRKRRDYLDATIYPALKERDLSQGLVIIEALQARDAAHRLQATDHLSQWPLERTLREFEEYLRAAGEVRSRIRAHLRIEREILEPMLAQFARQASVTAG